MKSPLTVPPLSKFPVYTDSFGCSKGKVSAVVFVWHATWGKKNNIQERFRFKIRAKDSADPEQTTCTWYVSE